MKVDYQIAKIKGIKIQGSASERAKTKLEKEHSLTKKINYNLLY